MNHNNLDQSELNKEWILELFYTTKGNLNDINRAIDKKLKIRGLRKITLFEQFIKIYCFKFNCLAVSRPTADKRLN